MGFDAGRWKHGVVAIGALSTLAGCKSVVLLKVNNKPYTYTMPAESKLGVHLHKTKLEFRTQPRPAIAGQPAVWWLKVLDSNSQPNHPIPIREFAVVHEKTMHLVVVSKDLEWFAHIHPDYKDNGLFLIRPTLPRPGLYKLYADYTPQDGRQEVAQQEFAAEVSKDGIGTPVHAEEGADVKGAEAKSADAKGAEAAAHLTPDEAGADGWVHRLVAPLPDGEPLDEAAAQTRPAYDVALTPVPLTTQSLQHKLVSEQDTLLHLRVHDLSGHDVTDLEPYLGVKGHMVILSASSNIYLHTHPLPDDDVRQALSTLHLSPPPAASSDAFFFIRFPKPGLYKLWAQFKHHDQILTAPIVIKVAANPYLSATQPATNAAGQLLYTCPMHPDISSTDPNRVCPRCGMALVQKTVQK